MINLIKLSVGTVSIHSLLEWQKMSRANNLRDFGVAEHWHTTRMRPKREAELLDGGSIYWVFKGIIQCRQKITRLDEVTGGDGIRRCRIVLDKNLHATATWPKRPFQGWRYLKAPDAPPDVAMPSKSDVNMPQELRNALFELGLL
ncbi:MAG: DUF1489 domain-containing protein [Rhizobiales bacterium]|nr:DUF1489 domain-containing protein [Hyphomicrobiales bacterium]NRB15752.1 DUF1489 domain-containing protein [Hyphomicrobiales bacterium]